jgi:hypothetical protein
MAVSIVALATSLPLAAWAEPLEPYLEHSASAQFTGEQVVACETPAGSKSVAIEITQADGVTTARNAVGGNDEVQLAGGTFSLASDEGVSGTSAALSAAIPTGMYSVSQVRNVQMLGRDAQRVTVVDGEGGVRAEMTFDDETGALLAARIRNADESIYCDIRMVEFGPVTGTTPTRDTSSVTRLERVRVGDDARLPEEVAGFVRLETYEWDRGGVIAYYSDGLFSFALLATDRPLVLDDVMAESVEINGDDYVRWFGAGQVIYVWEAGDGGVTMYGDLPLDLQQAVLDELPAPHRQSVLTRWWRNLFG